MFPHGQPRLHALPPLGSYSAGTGTGLMSGAESMPASLVVVLAADGEYAGVLDVLDVLEVDEDEPLPAPNATAAATMPPSTSRIPRPAPDEPLGRAACGSTCGVSVEGLCNVE